jgi:hypothetical protein
MNPIYCGNNAYHPDLLSGDRTLGTRYTCLQKGKDNGYSQPADPNFLLPYQPIDATKKYCGNKAALPVGYSRFGGLYECYLKGMGVGKKLKAQAGIPEGDSSSPPSPPYNSPNNSSEYDEKYGRNDFDIKYERDDSKESIYSINDIRERSRACPSGDNKDNESRGSNSSNKKYIVSLNVLVIGGIVYLMGLTIFFLGMYYGKPEIILDKNTNEGTTGKIDWSKFIPYLVSFAVIYALVIYFFINYLFR